MKVNILTPDSKRPNLAAMKISAWHKEQGDNVELNFPLCNADFTYASLLFNWTPDPYADLIGGSKYPHIKLDPEIDRMKPDYSLYPNIDYSLGYTYKACPRSCDFCIVPKQQNDETHYSIWDFHDERFKKICLLNNNTLADPQRWETYREIIDAKLLVRDDSGYDARLMTEEDAKYLARIKFCTQIHVAWDFMEHEADVIRGIQYMIDAGIRPSKITSYILVGFNTTEEEDIYRISKLKNMGIDCFVMPINKKDKYQANLARWCNLKYLFDTISYEDYKAFTRKQFREMDYERKSLMVRK